MVRKKSKLVLLLALLFVSISFVFLINSVSAQTFEFNGTVNDAEGNALDNSSINITIRDMNGFSIVGYNSTTTNATGWFNISVSENVAWMYEPKITWTNSTTGAVEKIGQSLPAFPQEMLSQVAGTTFYLKDAGTINITAINSSGGRISFRYQIKDQKLGYSVAQNFDASVNEAVVNIPRERNYSIMIFPDASMPVSFDWNNFSSLESYNITASNLSFYNFTTKTLHYQFNTTMAMPRVSGYINYSGVDNGWDEFTVIPYLLEPGNMVHSQFGSMPYNLSGFEGGTDEYDLTSGFYNITLPATLAETSNILLFATARNGSNYYGGFRNISELNSNGLTEFNFNNMAGLFGVASNISMETLGESRINISTAKHTFNIVNSTNSTLNTINAHIEVKVDYSGLGAIEFTWMNNVNQGSSSTFAIPLLNSTGIKEMNVFAGGGNYAPVRKSYTASDLAADNAAENQTNITLTSFNPGDIEGSLNSSSIFMALTFSNSTCSVPFNSEYPDSCFLGGLGGDKGTLDNFNPMKAVMGGAKLNFIMGKDDGTGNPALAIIYVNVDLLASGPPSVAFDSNSSESTGTGFSGAMRFGSGGPTIYDYVLVGMPYTEGNTSQTGLNESGEVNVSIPIFYDEDWNVIWNTANNGTNGSALAGNESHYSTYQSEWETLMANNTCHTNASAVNSTNPCYIDTTMNMIWVRLPHFSGTQPTVTGNVITTTSTSDNGGGSSGGGGSSTTFWTSTYVLNEDELKELETEQGFTRELAEKNQIRIKVGNETHHIGIVNLTSTTATINVSSTPQQAMFNIGDEKMFDLNDDGSYDLGVKLNSISDNKAGITAKLISEEIPVVTETEAGEDEDEIPTTLEEDEEAKSLLWLWILIILVVIGVVGFIIYNKKKK